MSINLSRSSPPITATFTIGPKSVYGRLGDTQPHFGHIKSHVGRLGGVEAPVSAPNLELSVIKESTSRLIAEQLSFDDRVQTAHRFREIARTVHDAQSPTLPFNGSSVGHVSGVIGRALADSRASVHVGDVVLSLYGVYQGSSRISKMLHIQRVIDGTPQIDVMLPEKVDIR